LKAGSQVQCPVLVKVQERDDVASSKRLNLLLEPWEVERLKLTRGNEGAGPRAPPMKTRRMPVSFTLCNVALIISGRAASIASSLQSPAFKPKGVFVSSFKKFRQITGSLKLPSND